jgi:heme/copper-type cytochrome/quinol oxidase subunit 2
MNIKKIKERLVYILDERLFAILILAVVSGLFSFSNKFVSGVLELKWAEEGTVYTNYNIGMFVLLAISACITVWIIYKYAKRSKLLVSIISCLVVALCMTISEIFYWGFPIILIIIFAILKTDVINKVRERRKKNDISNR